MAIHVSDDTVLRIVKVSVPGAEETQAIHHLGVDDWAWRSGQSYGTILVDLERRRVVDLLPDRSARSLANWLADQPGIQTVNRDWCGAYAEGAANGAPHAIQIADRFHLVMNFSEAVQRVLESHRRELEFPEADSEHRIPKDTPAPKPESAAQRMQSVRRCRRLERYQQVMMELHNSGHSQLAIGEALGSSRKTVRRWLRSQGFPERTPPSGRHSHGREVEEYLRRGEQRRHNAT